MKSVMQRDFQRIPAPHIQRSKFNRSHGHKTTISPDYLYPILVDEVLPGDTFTLTVAALARILSLITPVMDNIFLDFFFFFVPNRLLWTNWEKFMGAQTNPGDSTSYLIPNVVKNNGLNTKMWATEGDISDYMGLGATGSGTALDTAQARVSALPFRAYNLIWNEWFRDENLQNSVTVPTGDGPDLEYNSVGDITLYQLLKRGKRHDYFTSCLPWPQKGNSIMLPLGTTAPVIGDGNALGLAATGTLTDAYPLIMRTGSIAASLHIGQTVNETLSVGADTSAHSAVSSQVALGVTTNPSRSHLYADLSSATAATINQLRLAFQYQAVLEKDARGGTRYVEMVLMHFGVVNPDFRLQRPEYLGGSSQRINTPPVAQTSDLQRTDAGTAKPNSTPQGTLTSYGFGMGKAGFHKSFTEHGVLMGLVNVRGDINYQQGTRRMWTRSTRFDFYLPALANLGEQAVYNYEIYPSGSASDVAAFGYQERWAEYRYMPSLITGRMRSAWTTDTLHYWHLAEYFGSLPALNASFIQSNLNTPLDRAVAVTNSDKILLDMYFDYQCARPMPVFSIPANLARF